MKGSLEKKAKTRQVAANFLHLGMIQVSNALVQLLLFPIIIRKTGLEAFGPVVVANSFAALASLLVNYGTSISGVQGVAEMKNNREQLSAFFSQTLLLRILLLLPVVGCLPVVWLFAPQYQVFILPALMLVVNEAINPLYFFNGQEKLMAFNLANLVAKLMAVFLIILWVQGSADAPLVNFWLGLPVLLAYTILNLLLFQRYQLQWVRPTFKAAVGMLRKNLPLTGNNLAVQLQQSFFLFVLSAVASPLWLAAYALADKVIWGFRLVLIAFSNALFPRAVHLAAGDPLLARLRKKQINGVLAIVFTLVALLLYFFPGAVVLVFSGTTEPKAVALIQSICWVPMLAALNTLNVLEMLVQHRYQTIFRIALILTCITVSASLLVIRLGGIQYIGWYPFIVEAAALVLYLFFLRRPKKEVSFA